MLVRVAPAGDVFDDDHQTAARAAARPTARGLTPEEDLVSVFVTVSPLQSLSLFGLGHKWLQGRPRQKGGSKGLSFQHSNQEGLVYYFDLQAKESHFI